jgi:hypothetical protein
MNFMIIGGIILDILFRNHDKIIKDVQVHKLQIN